MALGSIESILDLLTNAVLHHYWLMYVYSMNSINIYLQNISQMCLIVPVGIVLVVFWMLTSDSCIGRKNTKEDIGTY